jgi:hypothetical protein
MKKMTVSGACLPLFFAFFSAQKNIFFTWNCSEIGFANINTCFWECFAWMFSRHYRWMLNCEQKKFSDVTVSENTVTANESEQSKCNDSKMHMTCIVEKSHCTEFKKNWIPCFTTGGPVLNCPMCQSLYMDWQRMFKAIMQQLALCTIKLFILPWPNMIMLLMQALFCTATSADSYLLQHLYQDGD